jgi:Ca2+-binding RTX toxin-like protein
VIAFPALGSVGVMLNNGDGTFAAVQQYTGGPNCVNAAVDVTLGDVTQPTGNPLLPDGKLDAYIACTPFVVRLRGNGAGGFDAPEAFNLGVAPYLGSGTPDMLALTRRPDGNPVPLLVFQGTVGPNRRLCTSYELDPGQVICGTTGVQGPLAVGDLNGTSAGIPPDEVVTSEGGALMGIFGWTGFPLTWSDSTRTVPGDSPGLESAALGDVDNDGDLDVVAGQQVNSVAARVQSIHAFKWLDATGLEQVPTPLASTPGLDAVAVTNIDGDGCNDIVAAGGYGRGMVHLGQGGGSFDGGQDLPQLGYQNPATATRVTLAVGNLTGDGNPELVVTDAVAQQLMLYRNVSTSAGIACAPPPPPPPPSGGGTPPVPAPGPTVPSTPAPPTPAAIRSCANPGLGPFLASTPGKDVLVGTAGRDVISGRGGDDCLFGFGNNDRLTGGTGDDSLSGGSGDDRLAGDAGADVLNGGGGSDRMTGGAGADKLTGGNGNEEITPGAGKDRVLAGGGNDTISARDRTRDTIDCGAGRDKVTADKADTVNRNCERVTRRR